MAYGTDQGLLDYLASQGLTLPTGSPTPEVLRNLGSAYVDSAYEWKLQCSSRANAFGQELAWPRTGHYVNGKEVPSDHIPLAWVQASYRAAYLNAVTPGWSTDQVTPGRITRKEQVDVISREYFSPEDSGGSGDAATGMPSDATINGLVKPWLCSDARSINSLFRVV